MSVLTAAGIGFAVWSLGTKDNAATHDVPATPSVTESMGAPESTESPSLQRIAPIRFADDRGLDSAPTLARAESMSMANAFSVADNNYADFVGKLLNVPARDVLATITNPEALELFRVVVGNAWDQKAAIGAEMTTIAFKQAHERLKAGTYEDDRPAARTPVRGEYVMVVNSNGGPFDGNKIVRVYPGEVMELDAARQRDRDVDRVHKILFQGLFAALSPK